MKKEKKKEEKKKVSKEEISEIFKIENGEEKIIETHTKIEKKEEEPPKKQIKKENKILKNVIIIMMGFVLMFFVGYMMIYYSTHFEIDGVKFEVIKMGQLTLYKTSIPGIINDSGAFIPRNNEKMKSLLEKADYNFYLRTDPRQLENIHFQGILRLKKENVLNLTAGFDCNGDGMIAIANLLKLYEVIGGNMIKDDTANCDEMGRYGFINIQKGEEETYIDRSGPACYNIFIKDCEILEGTERLMLETLIEVNKKLEL